MPTHEPRCAYYVLYQCERCGTLGLSREQLERGDCPGGARGTQSRNSE